MSYDKNTWAKGDVITAAKLNNMENGIANAGGGGVLVVTVDADDALDKTWQEIHDAGFAVIASDVSPEVGWLTQLYSNETGYYVAFTMVINGNVITVVYVAETADDYPAEE